jgi:hypothetical protein
MQKNQPWLVPYSTQLHLANDYLGYLLTNHAILHGMKSLGKLASEIEKLDHQGPQVLASKGDDRMVQVIKDMDADLVTIAIRLANLHDFDLESHLVARVVEKNGRGFEPPPEG